METDSEKENGGFRVTDRRRFDNEGNERPEDQEHSASQELKNSAEIHTLQGASGNSRASAAQQSSSTAASAKSHVRQESRTETNNVASEKKERPTSKGPERGKGTGDPLSIDFTSFIMSLASQALWQLGLMEPPPGMPVTVDKEAARQTIDILSLLEEKTQGNLDEGEEQLLSDILHQLRISFVRAV